MHAHVHEHEHLLWRPAEEHSSAARHVSLHVSVHTFSLLLAPSRTLSHSLRLSKALSYLVAGFQVLHLCRRCNALQLTVAVIDLDPALTCYSL